MGGFEDKNGARSFEEMRARIERYRRTPMSAAGVEPVGCIVLRDPFFLNPDDWIPQPADWSPNIVQGKGYADSSEIGRQLIDRALALRATVMLEASATGVVREVPGPIFGDPILVKKRLGQGSFRFLVTDAYGRCCAVSREKALPVLEAAHIRPVNAGGLHQVNNGLLLRSDIHTLFDRGYVTITPKGTFRASRRLKDDYDNGEPYFALEAAAVALPIHAEDRPDPVALEWHNDAVFLG
jgi:putative restriction endonuclease